MKKMLISVWMSILLLIPIVGYAQTYPTLPATNVVDTTNQLDESTLQLIESKLDEYKRRTFIYVITDVETKDELNSYVKTLYDNWDVEDIVLVGISPTNNLVSGYGLQIGGSYDYLDYYGNLDLEDLRSIQSLDVNQKTVYLIERFQDDVKDGMMKLKIVYFVMSLFTSTIIFLGFAFVYNIVIDNILIQYEMGGKEGILIYCVIFVIVYSWCLPSIS